MGKGLDYKNLSYIARQDVMKAEGLCNVLKERYWCVDPEKGLMFYNGSQQCHTNKKIAENLQQRLYPHAEVEYHSIVLVPINPRDYV